MPLMWLVHYRQPQGLDPDPLQISPQLWWSFCPSSIILSPQKILDEVRETSTSSIHKWGWIHYPGLLSGERESGLGILSGLELIHRPWDIMMTVVCVVWEYCRSQGKTKPFLELQSWVFSKCMRANYAVLSSCVVFSFVLLAYPISSFYTWELRHQSSSLYLDA